MTDSSDNPIKRPAELPAASDDSPKFGRLLVVLVLAVLVMVAITFASEAYYSK